MVFSVINVYERLESSKNHIVIYVSCVEGELISPSTYNHECLGGTQDQQELMYQWTPATKKENLKNKNKNKKQPSLPLITLINNHKVTANSHIVTSSTVLQCVFYALLNKYTIENSTNNNPHQ